MAVPIGLVFILFWVIGFPVYIFYKLFHKRHNLDDQEVILGYGLFFVGLSDKAFFWEVIVTNFRKVIFILCSTLLSTINPIYKVRTARLCKHSFRPSLVCLQCSFKWSFFITIYLT